MRKLVALLLIDTRARHEGPTPQFDVVEFELEIVRSAEIAVNVCRTSEHELSITRLAAREINVCRTAAFDLNITREFSGPIER